jgi:GAF domain-containing protein
MPIAGMLAEHTRLQVRLRDQAAEISSILQAQEAVASISSPTELFRRIADLALVSLGAQAACLMPFDKDRGVLRVAAQVGLDDEMVKRFTFRAGEGPAGDCYSDRVQILVRDVIDDRVLASKLERPGDFKAAVFAPLIARDECYGILVLFFGNRPMQRL